MKDGQLAGYDYTGDGKIDVDVKDLKGKPVADPDLIVLYGTSFASPYALSQDVKEKRRGAPQTVFERMNRNVGDTLDTLSSMRYWEPLNWRTILPESFFDD